MISKITKHSLFLAKVGLISFTLMASAFVFPELHHSFIRHKVGTAVVQIIDPDQGGGTGFHVIAKSGKTYIMTNVHICEMSKNEKPLLVSNSSLEDSIPRRVIYMSKKHDICLMEALPGVSGISLASSVDIGDQISIVGHPHLRPLTIEQGELISKDAKVTIPKSIILTEEQKKECSGEIVSVPSFFGILNVCVIVDYAYQANLIAYPGNSGSPIVNSFGNVVGLLFAGNSGAITDSYLVKLEYLKEVLEMF